ncbi:MAG: DoxX family protein [Flavobacteriales bacterium]
MRILLIICRILVGATFIISGLVKANDPLGFSYKLEEYFAPNALGWTAFEPWSLALAVLVCLGEVVLGFAILVGGRMRLATAATLVLAVFFGWLTYYTADCNKRQEAGEKMTYVATDEKGDPVLGPDGKPVEKDRVCVTDCGCFGDAMKDPSAAASRRSRASARTWRCWSSCCRCSSPRGPGSPASASTPGAMTWRSCCRPWCCCAPIAGCSRGGSRCCSPSSASRATWPSSATCRA